MSYIQSVIECNTCHKIMNVAFGVVGRNIIAQWPTECPDCKGKEFTKIHNGWIFNKPAVTDTQVP